MLFCAEQNVGTHAPEPTGHAPVLIEETVSLLGGVAGARILDATFGGGGHTAALLESADQVSVVALDRDPEAAARSIQLQSKYAGRFEFIATDFGDLPNLDLGLLDGALFDLGLSSFQLDDGARGFSFRFDAPADMRMDPEAGISAAEFLETATEAQLIEAIRDFGEERSWRRVVSAIIGARGSGRLERTRSLADLIAQNVPRQVPGRKAIHPATRSFQGIRIAVNDELGAIERALPAAFDLLRPGGRLVVISFHSLEDRIVKRFCRRVAGRPEHQKDSRTMDERSRRAKLLHTRGLTAGEAEINRNPRSRSARLRVVEKLPTQPEKKS